MLHIWGAKLFQPNASSTYLENHRPQPRFSPPALIYFFLPSAPIYPPWSALLQSTQKYTF